MYDRRVEEAVRGLLDRFPEAEIDETLWPAIKLAYIPLLHEHRQPECAETFYNSVACRVLHRRTIATSSSSGGRRSPPSILKATSQRAAPTIRPRRG